MCDTPPQPTKQPFLFVDLAEMWTASTSHSLLCSQIGGILQFNVVIDESFCQKASSLRLNVRPCDRRGKWCRLTWLTVNAGAIIKHTVLQGTTIWEQVSGPRRVVKLLLTQVSPKIMKAINLEESLCTFLQHSFPASSANQPNSTCSNVSTNGCDGNTHTCDTSVTYHPGISQLVIVLRSQCPVRKQNFTAQSLHSQKRGYKNTLTLIKQTLMRLNANCSVVPVQPTQTSSFKRLVHSNAPMLTNDYTADVVVEDALAFAFFVFIMNNLKQ